MHYPRNPIVLRSTTGRWFDTCQTVAPQVSLRGAKILLVEPDLGVAWPWYRRLARLECRVQIAETAELALAVEHEFGPRLVVVELILPRMSGLLLVQTLMAIRPDLAVVGLTPFNREDTARVAFNAGCACLVETPVNTNELVRVLVECLAERRAWGST